MNRIHLLILVFFAASKLLGQTPSVSQQVETSVALYLDLVGKYYFDSSWRKNNIPRLFHPDLNFLGAPMGYTFIDENLKSENGEYLFVAAQLTRVLERRTHVNANQPSSSLEDSYFLRLEFTAIASTNNGRRTIFQDPSKIVQYVVLAKDPADGGLKIIYTYPALGKLKLVGVRCYLDMSEKTHDYHGDFERQLKLKRESLAGLGPY